MHVVIVSDYAHAVGGAERVAIDSALGLRAAGVAVSFVAGMGPVDPELAASGAQVVLADLQDLRRKSKVDLLVSGLWSTAVARLLAAHLEKCPVGNTVVHVHGWQRVLTAAALKAIEQGPHPSVVTLHEFGLACPNQGFYNYQSKEICQKRALGLDCLTTHCDTRTYAHKLWRAARVGTQRYAVGWPSQLRHVIYLSELSRTLLQPYFGSGTQWHGVRNPVRVQLGARNLAEARTDFLFVGRVSREKGADLFAAAAARAGVPATVAGDGPELVGLRDLFPGVNYLGWVGPDALWRCMAEARVLVFPSIWYETFGLTVQEALSAGVPVLVADGTAAREAVVPGVNGLLFKHGSVEDLSEQMRLLAADYELVTRLSEGAHRHFWQDPPTLQAHVAALLDVYRQCLSPHRSVADAS